MLNVNGNRLDHPVSVGPRVRQWRLSDEDDLYFAAGIGDEQHGLFGEIGAVAVSEPGTAGLLLLAMAGLFAMRPRRTWMPEHCGVGTG